MAGQRQPIELVLAKGSKHLTKKEIEERKSSEVKPITDDIFPPPYLITKKQKEEFNNIANQPNPFLINQTDSSPSPAVS